MKLPFEILYEDRDILVVYKKSGIAVQTARIGEMDLESHLKNYLVSKKESPYLAVIHRLDQPVCGILVFGKNEKAAAKLSALMQSKEPVSGGKQQKGSQSPATVKEYLAIVEGEVPTGKIRLTDYLQKQQKGNLSKVVPESVKGAKKAMLQYEKVDRYQDLLPEEVSLPYEFSGQWEEDLQKGEKSLVKITLYTGRHHQIRVQMAHAGFPLVGDAKYGGAGDGKALRLCAFHLAFPHPATGKMLEFWALPTS